ncbi:TAP-like protein-domain-containing protein [Hypoxylon sp. FL0890]|nr:TAP-like protein-domain-containing protein [Hypoxylon sp. FL0890]
MESRTHTSIIMRKLTSRSGQSTGCVEARENCALAKGNNKTADELEQAVWDLLDTVKYRPFPAGPSYMIDYSNVKGIIVQALYNSAGWPALAVILNDILTGQLDTLETLLDVLYPTNFTDIFAQIAEPLALAGIHCSDNMVRTEKFEDFLPAVQRMYNTSKIIGDALVFLYSACAQWKIEPKERYTGDFNVKTRNPVLFIGNSYDALTPLVSAKNVSATFEGSVVLKVEGYGHSSLAAPSACTIRTTSAYWANGTLPPEGKVCELDAPLYSGITWADVINQVYGNGTATAKRHVPTLARLGSTLKSPFSR